MKIGILSDIHGNADALSSVLSDVTKAGITRLFILGDIVGYYYHPDKVLDLLAGWDHLLIRGNHEDMLESIIHGTEDDEKIYTKYGSGHRMAMKKLSDQQLQYLLSAPAFTKVIVDEITLSLNHGASFDQSVYLYPDTDISLLNRCDDGSDFVFVGHSHYPFIHRTANGLLVNVGSVGQSRVRGGIASWCILNTDNRSVEMQATPYLTDDLISEVESTDPQLPYLSSILKRNNPG